MMEWRKLMIDEQPCSVCVPDKSGEYLVALKDTDPLEYSDGSFEDLSCVIKVQFDFDQMIFYDGDGWFWNAYKPETTAPMSSYIITHWMPLPDLPFEKKVKADEV